MRSGWLPLVLPLVLVTTACQVHDLDLSGRACPCEGDAWVCDASRDLCLPVEGGGNGDVEVGNLRGIWTTPNQIRWQWDPVGAPDRLLAYELALADSQQELLEGRNLAVFTAADNPELGRFERPSRTGVETVVFTTTDELAPDHVYYARLFALDTESRVSVSNVASARTTPPATQALLIFSEAEPQGVNAMGTLSVDAPYRGTYHLAFTSTCPNADCWSDLSLSGLGLSLSGIFPGSYTNSAYVELAVATTASSPPYWAETALGYGACGASCRWQTVGWTVRAGGAYRLMQFPLRILTGADSGQPADYRELANGLDEVRVSASWEAGSQVRIDEVFLRW